MVIFQPDRETLKQAIAKYADKIKGVFLDAGSGQDGRYDGYFKFEKKISVDIDENKKPDYITDLKKIPLKDNSVDSILCTQVIGDIDEPLLVLKEFYRVLRSGGYILLTESLVNELHDEPNDFWRFTPHSMKFLFEKSGFKIEAIEKRGGFYAMRAQNQIRYLINKYDLYNRQHIAWLRFLIRLYGQFMMKRDKNDKSKPSRQFALGWLVVAVKE